MIPTATNIEKRIELLVQARNKLKSYAEDKAKALVDYEKNMAITMAQLKSGEKFYLDDCNGDPVEIQDTSATNRKDLAKGICHEWSMKHYLAEALYKNCSIQIDAIKAEMNGYQSINRHLSETNNT